MCKWVKLMFFQNNNRCLTKLVIFQTILFCVIIVGLSGCDGTVSQNISSASDLSQAVSLPSSSSVTINSNINNEVIVNGEPIDGDSPLVQKAFLVWTSFGGYPSFTNVNAITSSTISELYANYCNSNDIPIAFSYEYNDGSKWMKAEPVEQFAQEYFGVEPNKLHDSTEYYDEQKGYRYPLVFPVAPESAQIISAKSINEEQISIKLEYVFNLPPDFYAKPGKVKAVHTVIIRSVNDYFTFVSADIDDERKNYKE